MERRNDVFLTAATSLALVGCIGATVSPLVAGASTAYAGSVVTSGALGIVFAARSVQVLRDTGAVGLPAAVLTTIFGGWFMSAPLPYEVGFLATAGTQLSGTAVSTFGLYVVVAGLTDAAS